MRCPGGPLTEPTHPGIPEIRGLLGGRWRELLRTPPRSGGSVQAAGRCPQRETEHHVQKAPLHLQLQPAEEGGGGREFLLRRSGPRGAADPQQLHVRGRGPRGEIQRVLKEIQKRQQHGHQPVLPAAGGRPGVDVLPHPGLPAVPAGAAGPAEKIPEQPQRPEAQARPGLLLHLVQILHGREKGPQPAHLQRNKGKCRWEVRMR